MSSSSGILYIVPTPIGNLEDLTVRALNTLKAVDAIAAEDTRHTRKLLQHYSIDKPLESFHDHSPSSRVDKLLDKLEAGQSIAYVTDAGMPGIADPGFVLIRAARARDLTVTVLPGATALITALVGSGLPMERFIFDGFLPPKSGKRQNRLRDLADESRTLIFYESPHRILKCLQDILLVMGDRPVCIGRELTKIYEEYICGAVTDAITHFDSHEPKGEMVIILAGADRKTKAKFA